jgi:hypothetical protein
MLPASPLVVLVTADVADALASLAGTFLMTLLIILFLGLLSAA